jgi:hypothetical protein
MCSGCRRKNEDPYGSGRRANTPNAGGVPIEAHLLERRQDLPKCMSIVAGSFVDLISETVLR